jgi:lipoprotein-releasing system ATP-binding protein
MSNRADGVLLQVEDLHKSYPTAGDPLHVLRGLDLKIEEGEIVAIVGASGSGKSTLLHIIGALDRPTSGRIVLAGNDLNTLWDEALAEVRNREIGYVFQSHHLLPEFTAQENVALPAMMAGKEPDDAMARALELLDVLDLSDRADHRPVKLSGGEQQRVAVARALTNGPSMVLADEPSGNLDESSSETLHDLLWGLNKSEGQTLVLVTHNMQLASRAHRILELSEGLLHPKEI